MRIIIIAVFLIYGVLISNQHSPFDVGGTLDSIVVQSCDYTQISQDFRAALYEFNIGLYQIVANRSNLNFVYSPISIWIILAALAEGAEPYIQHQLFKFLNLPYDPCIRKRYYELATSRISSSSDVRIVSNRILLINEGVTINPPWLDLVVANKLIDVLTIPTRNNQAVTIDEFRRLTSGSMPIINLQGNSIISDTMVYNGLWTTAFSDAKIERAPFYNQLGHVIGAVDLMKVKRLVRMGYNKSLNVKVLELLVGKNGRYRMMFVMSLGTQNLMDVIGNFTKENLYEMFTSLRKSFVPLDVAIPRIILSSQLSVRKFLKELGVTSLWRDPAATRYVSTPAALPSSFIQRTTLTFNTHGIFQAQREQNYTSGTPTGLDPVLGTDFIANRPFLFGLFDAETLSVLISAAYSVPTFKY